MNRLVNGITVALIALERRLRKRSAIVTIADPGIRVHPRRPRLKKASG